MCRREDHGKDAVSDAGGHAAVSVGSGPANGRTSPTFDPWGVEVVVSGSLWGNMKSPVHFANCAHTLEYRTNPVRDGNFP